MSIETGLSILPPWKELEVHEDPVMTNLGHRTNVMIAKLIKEKLYIGWYVAWDFAGQIWFDDNKYYCVIQQYKENIETIKTDSLKEIMDYCCEKYGSS